jgi:hypothetical protein
VTRNKSSEKAEKLETAGAVLVEADLDDLASLKEAVHNSNIIFAVTDFIAAGSIAKETQQGINILDAALTTLETLETFIWSNLPDARTQEVPYQNVFHFNSKNDISNHLKESPLQNVLTEVIVGGYYQNFVKAPQVYAPQKVSLASQSDMERMRWLTLPAYSASRWIVGTNAACQPRYENPIRSHRRFRTSRESNS